MCDATSGLLDLTQCSPIVRSEYLLEVVVMRTSARSLEIVAIGLGQAGGNLAAEFARRGYPALSFNTAATDLATLTSRGQVLADERRVYIGVDGNDGAGSDPSYGRECVAAHAEMIRECVADLTRDADVVLLTCGLGGGTGSAIAELVAVLQELSLPLVVLATLPAEHENSVTKVNAVRAVNELVAESLLGWIFVDNSRLTELHGDIALDRFYFEINKIIVEQFDVWNSLNDRPTVRAIRPLDGEDFRTLLLAGGLMAFGTQQLTTLDAESIFKAVRECLEASRLMPSGYTLEGISYLGIALDAPDAVLSATPFSVFEEVSQRLKEETGGAAVYLGTYRDFQPRQATLRVIASSQTLPEGMRTMVGSAQREGKKLRSKLDQTVSKLDLKAVEEIELLRPGAGASRRMRSKAPGARTPSAAPTAFGSPPSGDRLTVVNAVDRKVYEGIVSEYRNSESDLERARLAGRLYQDARASDATVRLNAVRAMARVDPALFAEALQAASLDPDASVRAMASRALQLPESRIGVRDDTVTDFTGEK
jgi:cell division GTPase FtsZ